MKNGFHKDTDSERTKLPNRRTRQSTSKSGTVAANKNGRKKSSRRGWGRRKKKRADSLALAIVGLILFGSIITGIIYLVSQGKDAGTNLDTSSQQSVSSVELDLEENADKATNDLPSLLSKELQDILNKHLEAMGGMYSWRKVESIRLNGTIERDGQLVEIVIVNKRPNQIRATVTVPLPGHEEKHMQIIRAHDGKTAWTATRLAGSSEIKKEILPPKAAAELLADAGVLPPLIKLWREGSKLKLLADEDFNGVLCTRIEASVNGSELTRTFYLNKETYRLAGYVSKTDLGSNTTTISDYAMKSDVMIPTHNIIDAPETGRSVMKIRSIELGVGIHQEYFKIGQIAESAKLD